MNIFEKKPIKKCMLMRFSEIYDDHFSLKYDVLTLKVLQHDSKAFAELLFASASGSLILSGI